MNKNYNKNRRGITAVEIMIAGVIVLIGMLSVSVVLSDSQRGWNTMYGRIYSDVVVDGHIAKRMFDVIIRKSSATGLQIDAAGEWVEVCYYATDESTVLDRYARFFCSENTLFVEHGRLNPKETLSINTVSGNVTNCVFKQSGRSVHMLLTLSKGLQTLTIGSSAELHN